MKRFFTNISITISLLLILEGCQKTTTGVFVPNPSQQPDTTWYPTDSIPTVTDTFQKPVTTDSFNCVSSDDGSKISINDSFSIIFPNGGCMTTQNKPSTTITNKSAKIKANIMILTSIGDIIRHRVPTLSNGNLLNIGAYVNIKLSYKGNPVYWNSTLQKPIQIKVRTKDKYPLQQYIQYFMFQADSTGKDTFWLPVPGHGQVNQVTPTYVGNGSQNSPNNGYLMNSNKVGWFGCASFLPILSKTTRINAFLPITFTNKNTVVYAVFNNSKTLVRLKSNPLGKSYGASGIPVNAAITIVSISKIDGKFYLGTNQTIATSSDPIKISPNLIDKYALEQYLLSL